MYRSLLLTTKSRTSKRKKKEKNDENNAQCYELRCSEAEFRIKNFREEHFWEKQRK